MYKQKTLNSLEEDPTYVYKLMDNEVKDSVNALIDKNDTLQNDPKKVANIYATYVEEQLNPEEEVTIKWFETDQQGPQLKGFCADEEMILK